MADQTLAQLVRAKYPGVYDKLNDQELESKVRAKYPGTYDKVPSTSTAAPTSRVSAGIAVPLALAAAALPAASQGAMSIATNPNLWKTGAAIGEAAGGIGGFLGGLKGSMPAFEAPMGAAAGMYAGRKAGWRLANVAQRVAKPLASVAEKIGPEASKVLGMLGGAQGVLELAQMAEPNRQDIGMLGLGKTADPAAVKAKAAAAQQAYVGRLVDQTKADIASGTAPSKAAMKASGGVPSLFALIMGHIMKSGGVR